MPMELPGRQPNTANSRTLDNGLRCTLGRVRQQTSAGPRKLGLATIVTEHGSPMIRHTTKNENQGMLAPLLISKQSSA